MSRDFLCLLLGLYDAKVLCMAICPFLVGEAHNSSIQVSVPRTLQSFDDSLIADNNSTSQKPWNTFNKFNSSKKKYLSITYWTLFGFNYLPSVWIGCWTALVCVWRISWSHTSTFYQSRQVQKPTDNMICRKRYHFERNCSEKLMTLIIKLCRSLIIAMLMRSQWFHIYKYLKI